MTITAIETTRFGNVTTVTATSDLGGSPYFHWYVDGTWVGVCETGTWDFYLPLADQARIDVVDTADPAFDAVAGAPAGWPARRTLWWVRSLAADVDQYRVEQKKGEGDWSTVAIVHQEPHQWEFSVLTDRLDDLSDYTWQVVPVDTAGNDGTPIAIGPETIVRTPDAPEFEITFDSGTTKVTFSAAS